MTNPLRDLPASLLLAALTLSSSALHASCGAAFCTLNTNWNLQGLAPEPGFRLDLRYEYIDQDQPTTGRDRIAAGQIPRHHDEVKTVNRNTIGTLDYTFNSTWSLSATVPVSDRSHTHLHNHRGAQLVEEWDFTRMGDMRVLGRYQHQSENAQQASLGFYGVNFGLKLPTGARDLRNAAGDRAERTLQPGTGTTDLLLGAYYNGVLPAVGASWFVQMLWQLPLDSKEDYRPGQRLSVDLGYRYEATDRLGLLVQLNALRRERDSGVQAEPEDTGGTFLFVSPGVSYAITKKTQLYGFIQKPVYQYVNGVQLTADWLGVVGLSTRF